MYATRIACAASFLFLTTCRSLAATDAKPIALHPDNPHYFLFRGKPAILVGSTEHYGAVLNGDIDQVKYLDALQSDGLNLTRTFSGVYREVPGSFHIAGNTLAPKAEAYVAPWARSDTPGAQDGGNKFDLSRWDERWSARLIAFVVEAGRRGVVVEFVLFCPFYDDTMWAVSPMNAKNNVNGAGDLKRDRAYTLDNGKLLEFQDAFVRKAAAELRDFGNVYFEICNEPYFGGVTPEWQKHVAATIADAEKDLPARHLIAQNVANGAGKVGHPDPAVSIFNFHYANPPDAVAQNFALDKVVGYDETGFKGTADDVYRVHGWEFLLAGGAVYDNLDYSFTVGREDGTVEVKRPTPGGGGPALRRELRTMKEFVEGFEFTHMRPVADAARGLKPDGTAARVMAEPGKQYAIYLRHADGRRAESAFILDLPAGKYRVQWLDPVNGKSPAPVIVESGGAGGTELHTPAFDLDLAAKVTPAREGP